MRTALLLMALCYGQAAYAALPPPELYEARTIVTGTDMRSRPRGFADCLRDVLIKVSGDPALQRDARIGALDAPRFVDGFDYVDRMSGIPHHDEQGSSDRPYYLTVRFDRAKIASVLRSLGETVWTGARPVIRLVIVVSSRTSSYVLTEHAADGVDQRAAIQDAADRYDVAARVPGEESEHLPAQSLAITGALVWSDASLGWIGAWQLVQGTQVYHWSVRGVSFDEAFRSAVLGGLGVATGHSPDGQNAR